MTLIWINYTHNSRALVKKDSSDIYAILRTIKKRGGGERWEVKAYSRYEGNFPGLERIYDYEKQYAVDAALKIASEIMK